MFEKSVEIISAQAESPHVGAFCRGRFSVTSLDKQVFIRILETVSLVPLYKVKTVQLSATISRDAARHNEAIHAVCQISNP